MSQSGNFHFGEDLFIGKHELNRFQEFMQEKGYKEALLNNSISFGLIHKDIVDGEWNNFRVELGTNVGTIKVNDGVAIDKNGNVLKFLFTDNITSVPSTNAWVWIKAEHQVKITEDYLVSISNTGSLSGIDSKFLEVLRGESNNAVKISFPFSSQNTREYSVLEVISDTEAVLMGDFIAESNIKMAVVGSFTPDVPVSSDKKYPYQYDSSLLTYVAEVTPNTPPAVSDDTFFWLARVKRNGNAISITDERSRNIWRTKADYEQSKSLVSDNPLIGVESITFDNIRSTRDENVITFAWGFQALSFTFDSASNRATIIGGKGGLFKDTSYFTDGDWDQWRCYTSDGSYTIIKQSTVTALQISLLLDTLDVVKFTNSDTLTIVPDVEEIDLLCASFGANNINQVWKTFPIDSGYVKFNLPVFNTPSCQYTIVYRYKNFTQYSKYTLLPDDAVGYYPESQFDPNGNLIGSTRLPYTNGRITLQDASNSYANVVSALSDGSIAGVEYKAIDTSVNPVTDLIVGTTRQWVVITNDDDLDQSDADFGTQYLLTANAYLNLKSIDVTLKNGNRFYLQIRGDYNLNGHLFRIVQDYVNEGNPGVILANLTTVELAAAKTDGLLYVANWDGERWFLKKIADNSDSTDWSDLPLINGWAVSGGVKPQWRRIGKQVFLRGRLDPSGASNSFVCPTNTLPNGVANAVSLSTNKFESGSDGHCVVSVNTSEQLTIASIYFTASIIYLDGVNYFIE